MQDRAALPTIVFTPPTAFRILDHRVTLPYGSEVVAPMRAMANGDSTEVIFTLFRQPGMDDAMWKRDEDWVKGDLERLRQTVSASHAKRFQKPGRSIGLDSDALATKRIWSTPYKLCSLLLPPHQSH